MPSLEKLLHAYAQQHLPLLPQSYVWKFDAAVVAQQFQVAIAGDSWYAKTCALKNAMATLWAAHPEHRMAYAHYAVSTWGGVRTNAPATMERYVHIVGAGQLPAHYQGIASWSKVAAFSAPQEHAIFDARVSFSLNALQLLQGAGEGCWFPKLPGRNTLLTAVWPLLQAHARLHAWQRLPAAQVYPRYMAALREVSQALGVTIGDVEMLLFAKAEALAHAVREAAQ